MSDYMYVSRRLVEDRLRKPCRNKKKIEKKKNEKGKKEARWMCTVFSLVFFSVTFKQEERASEAPYGVYTKHDFGTIFLAVFSRVIK